MITDLERLTEEIEFLRNNVGFLANWAHGNFIDPMVRPKSDRKTFTEKQYTKVILERCEYWLTTEEVPLFYKLKYLNGLKGFTLQALDNQFTRYRDLYNMMIRTHEFADVEFKKETKRIRDSQKGWDWHDMKLVCPATHLPVYIRKADGNYISSRKKGSRLVCECKVCIGLRKKMQTEITRRRNAKKALKPKKKDPERYRK